MEDLVYFVEKWIRVVGGEYFVSYYDKDLEGLMMVVRGF